jgi:hypothetical protein
MFSIVSEASLCFGSLEQASSQTALVHKIGKKTPKSDREAVSDLVYFVAAG